MTLSRATQTGGSVSRTKLSRFRACEPPPPASHPLEPLLEPFRDDAARLRRDEDFLVDLLEFLAMATVQGRFDIVETALPEIDVIARRARLSDLGSLSDSLRVEVDADSPHPERMLALLNSARMRLASRHTTAVSGHMKEIGA